MSQNLVLPVAGLLTGASRSVTPPGSLLKAENVMCVRPGVIDPRPGFKVALSTMVPSANSYTRGIIEYVKDRSNGFLCHNYDGTTHSAKWGDNTNVSPAPRPPNFAWANLFGVLARKNLYVPANPKPVKFTAISGQYEAVSIPPPVLEADDVGGGSGNYLEAVGSTVPGVKGMAFRAVIRRTDSNGLVVRSSPSLTATWAINDGSSVAAAATNVRLRLWNVGDYQSTDVVEVYRTLNADLIDDEGSPTTTDPSEIGDDYFLFGECLISNVVSQVLPAASFTALDENLGAALYTNADQEGATAGNWVMPSGTTGTYWRDCLWLGNVYDSMPSLTATLQSNSAGTSFGYVDTTVDPAGVGQFTATVGSATGLRVGQELGTAAAVGTSTNFPAGTTITAISGTTITLSAAATSDTGAVSRRFRDVIRFKHGSTVVYTIYADSATADNSDNCQLDVNPALRTEDLVDLLIQTMNSGNNSVARVQVIGFEPEAPSDASTVYRNGNVDLLFYLIGPTAAEFGNDFGIASSLTTLFAPALPPSTTSIQYRSYPTYFPNRLYYSKPYEPEHVPLLNYIEIGRADARIIRLQPLRDAMLVFKEDGLYRITGSAPSNWTVDLIDEDLFLCSPETACRYESVCYAWTNRGVVVCTEFEVQPLSSPRLDPDGSAPFDGSTDPDEVTDLRYAARRMRFMNESTPDKGAYALAIPHRGLVIFAVPKGLNESRSAIWWVYSVETQQWTTWDLRSRCAAYDSVDSLVLVESGRESFAEIRKERYDLDLDDYADAQYSITPSWSSPTTFTYTGTSYSAKVGDIVYSGGSSSKVTENSNGGITIAESIGEPGSATLVESVRHEIRWQPQTVNGPHLRAIWRELQVAWSDVDADTTGAPDVYFDFYADASVSTTGVARAMGESSRFQVNVDRIGLPKNVVRAYSVSPAIRIYGSKCRWRLNTAQLTYQPYQGVKGVNR